MCVAWMDGCLQILGDNQSEGPPWRTPQIAVFLLQHELPFQESPGHTGELLRRSCCGVRDLLFGITMLCCQFRGLLVTTHKVGWLAAVFQKFPQPDQVAIFQESPHPDWVAAEVSCVNMASRSTT